MKINLSKQWIIIISTNLVLSFLNPTRRDLNEYLGYSSETQLYDAHIKVSKKFNFLLFDIFWTYKHYGNSNGWDIYTHPNQVCNKIEGCFMI